MAQQGRELHEDWIEKAFRKQIEQRDKVGVALANMMRSDWGEAITYVFESARETYKDAYLWAEDDKERAHAKGGILCIEAIGTQVHVEVRRSLQIGPQWALHFALKGTHNEVDIAFTGTGAIAYT